MLKEAEKPTFIKRPKSRVIADIEAEELEPEQTLAVVEAGSLWFSDRLLNDGSPTPEYSAQNFGLFGFTCPREEYIQATRCPSLRELARKWGLSPRTLARWMKAQHWGSLRTAEWKRIEQERWALTKDAIVETQLKEITDQRKIIGAARAKLVQMLEKGLVQRQNALGGIDIMDMDFGDISKAARTLDLLNKAMERTVGLGGIVTGKDKGTTEINSLPPIQTIVINMQTNVPEKEFEKPLEAECIEGEVKMPELNAPEDADKYIEDVFQSKIPG